MDYSKMSDLEININVAELLHPGKKFTAAYSFFQPEGPAVQWICGYAEYIKADYCNNPADAWPIIIDNKLSLNNYGETWEASFEHDEPVGAFGTDEVVTSGVEDKNPLRALMIAFLMKVEIENAKIPSERDS